MSAGSERSFEDAQRELERIVERLERGDAALDEAIALWERGEELYRLCAGRLDAAQGKIEELARRVESSRPETTDLDDSPAPVK
jgi:exodeoxyribonuclease VII small subunit